VKVRLAEAKPMADTAEQAVKVPHKNSAMSAAPYPRLPKLLATTMGAATVRMSAKPNA
jgi:hypothetical protein